MKNIRHTKKWIDQLLGLHYSVYPPIPRAHPSSPPFPFLPLCFCFLSCSLCPFFSLSFSLSLYLSLFLPLSLPSPLLLLFPFHLSLLLLTSTSKSTPISPFYCYYPCPSTFPSPRLSIFLANETKFCSCLRELHPCTHEQHTAQLGRKHAPRSSARS